MNNWNKVVFSSSGAGHFDRHNKKEFKSFKKHCKNVVKGSLINGFRPIAIAESSFVRIVRILVLLCGIGGFFYQTHTFMQFYWQYSTVQNVSPMGSIIRPALTICDENLISRTVFCTEKPHLCDWYSDNVTEFCTEYKDYCPSYRNVTPVPAIPQIPISYEDLDYELLQRGGFKYEDLDRKWCYWIEKKRTSRTQIYPDKKTDCRTSKFVRLMDRNMNPHGCSVLDYHEDIEREPEMTPKDAGMILILPWNYIDAIIPTADLHYYISLHDPRDIINPFYYGFNVSQHGIYEVNAYQETENRMPAPYATDCYDYLSVWKKKGGRGPLNKMECDDECTKVHYFNENQCVVRSVVTPHDLPLCELTMMTGLNPASPSINNCTQYCKEACWESKYVVTTREVGKMSRSQRAWFKGRKMVLMFILIERGKSRQTQHTPKYESVEISSYIGSYLGMWLGWSIIALLDLLGIALRLLKYPFEVRKRRKKIVQDPIEFYPGDDVKTM